MDVLKKNDVDLNIAIFKLIYQWEKDEYQTYDEQVNQILRTIKLVNNCSYKKESMDDKALGFWNPKHPKRRYFVKATQPYRWSYYLVECCNNEKTQPTVGIEVASYNNEDMTFVAMEVLRMVGKIDDVYNQITHQKQRQQAIKHYQQRRTTMVNQIVDHSLLHGYTKVQAVHHAIKQFERVTKIDLGDKIWQNVTLVDLIKLIFDVNDKQFQK